MRKRIKKLTSNPLISGSFLIFSSGVIASFFSFLSNLVMSRNLSLSDYGAYISIISLVLLAVIPASSVVPAIISLSGSYFAHDDQASLKALYFKFSKPIVIAGLAITVLFTIFLDPISKFLHLNNHLLLILSFITVFFGYIGTVNSGFLQARLSFKIISLSNVAASGLRFLVGAILVFLGFGFSGALSAFFLSALVPVAIGFITLRKIFLTKFELLPHISYKSLFEYGIPSAVSIFAINSFISSDIILVKHFFSPEKAGLFAGLSLVGKVVFYLTAPIGNVMFPIAVRKFSKNEDFNHIFLYSFLLVSLIAFSLVGFYFVFPEFTTLFFLKNKEYLSIAPSLGLYAIFMALYSLVSLVMYFFLSIKKTSVSYIVLLGAVLQVILIILFHGSFAIVIGNSIAVLSLLLFVLLLYYVIVIKTPKSNANDR